MLDVDPDSQGPPSWTGLVYSLDETANPAGFDLADSLDTGHLLILDGENTTVARLDLSQPGALERLDLMLVSLS